MPRSNRSADSHSLESPQTLYEAETLRGKVGAVAQQVAARLAEANPFFLASRRGSIFFLGDLLRAFPRSVQYRLIDPISPTESELELASSGDYQGRTVVVVRDLVTTGVVDELLRVSLEKVGAEEILFVSLIDIPAERRIRFAPDYTVLTTGRDGVLVGYGLKYRGHYGNLAVLGQVQALEPPPHATEE